MSCIARVDFHACVRVRTLSPSQITGTRPARRSAHQVRASFLRATTCLLCARRQHCDRWTLIGRADELDANFVTSTCGSRHSVRARPHLDAPTCRARLYARIGARFGFVRGRAPELGERPSLGHHFRRHVSSLTTALSSDCSHFASSLSFSLTIRLRLLGSFLSKSSQRAARNSPSLIYGPSFMCVCICARARQSNLTLSTKARCDCHKCLPQTAARLATPQNNIAPLGRNRPLTRARARASDARLAQVSLAQRALVARLANGPMRVRGRRARLRADAP